MTTIKVQEALKTALENEVLKNLNLFGDKKIQVFLQDVPLSKDYEYEGLPDADKYFPCVVIKAVSGEVKRAAGPQETRINIYVVTKDESDDMAGYKDILIVLDRIRDYLISGAGIHDKARLLYPVTMAMIDDDFPYPYFEGALSTLWDIDVMPYKDIENLL